MNLDFSDDQKFLQSEARKFFDKEQACRRGRAVMDAGSDLDQDLWNQIVSMGWTGIRIPEQYEGLGLGHLELCVIAEELGRSLAHMKQSEMKKAIWRNEAKTQKRIENPRSEKI